MYDHTLFDDEHDDVYAQFDRQDRQARKKRKPKVHHKTKKSASDQMQSIADTPEQDVTFDITYQASLFEQGWLHDALRPFLVTDMITDVVALVKGGKEASVYRCRAHESVGTDWLAVKVYRPRMFRQLRNDSAYREGRELLDQDGKLIRENETRVMRAVNKKSAFGQQVRHTSWLSYEYQTLQKLHELGADVPKPYAVGENAILMEYIGGAGLPAKPLSETALDRQEAHTLYQQVLHNIQLMLDQHMVHGDLSAYNILYWQGDVTLIDFPQVVDAMRNQHARTIFERDVQRVCEYFQRQGVKCYPRDVSKRLWATRYGDAVPIDYDLHNE